MNKEEKNKMIKDIINQRESLKDKPIIKIDTSKQNLKRISAWRNK